MTTVEDRLRAAGASLEPPELEPPPFRSLRRRVRRRRLAALSGFVAVVACASVVVGAANARDRVEVSHVVPTSTTGVRSSEPTTSSTTAVLDPATRAVITHRLAAYVGEQQAKDTTAGTSSPDNVWGDPVIVEVSPPVEVGGRVLAVAAYSFDPGGRPVQILSYANQTWSPVALLAAPTAPGTIVHAGALDLISEGAPIAVANVTDTTRPDFLIEFAGGGCVNDAMVSSTGTREQWRYVPFGSPFPTGDLLGGNPTVIGGVLTSTNDCAATVAPSERRSWTWTYDVPSGTMIGHERVGWPARPRSSQGAVNGIGG